MKVKPVGDTGMFAVYVGNTIVSNVASNPAEAARELQRAASTLETKLLIHDCRMVRAHAVA